MAIQLVVTIPFGTYKIGDHITDEAEMAKALSTNPGSVVKVAYETKPELQPPVAPPKPTPSVVKEDK